VHKHDGVSDNKIRVTTTGGDSLRTGNAKRVVNSRGKARRRFDDVLTIGDDVLRGVPLASLLHVVADGGSAARKDPARCYALSQPVDSLSHFCSHSWRAPRLAKWLAISFHFNFAPSIATLFLFLAVTFHIELFYFDDMPTGALTPAGTLASIRYCPLCSVVTIVVLPPLLLGGHCLFGAARRARLFLDVACINQADRKQKAAGIAAFGAILDRSESMLVLTDETYWSRAWDIFEVVAFAHRAGFERCIFVPMHLATLDASMLAYGLMYNALPIVSWLGLGASGVFSMIIGLFSVFIPQIFMVAAFVEGRRSREALETLSCFSLDDVQCHTPGDKAEILEMIGSWFSLASAGESNPGVLQQIGQHRFTTFVRYNLRLQIQRSLSDASGLSPRTKLLGLAVTLPTLLDTVASPDVTLAEVLLQTGTNTLTWMIFGFDVWLGALSKCADIVASAIDRGCWAVAAYTMIVVPLLFLIALVSMVCTAMSGVPLGEALAGPRADLLGGVELLPAEDLLAVKMGTMVLLATLLQQYLPK